MRRRAIHAIAVGTCVFALGAAVTAPSRSSEPEHTWQVAEMEVDLLPGGDHRGAGIVIGLIERSDVDAGHPALAGAILDSDHGGTVAGVHATGVASLMVGQPTGAVPGIAPGARVYPVNIGASRENDMIAGIITAVDAGADVINISMVLGCKSFLMLTNCPDGLRMATDYAEARGVVVIAGAGNNGAGDGCDGSANADKWPAILDTVISVGAYGPDGDAWICSPDRTDIDVLAPGVDLLVADAGSGYAVGTGTSFAAPLVSGLIAVILSERPDLDPADIRALLPEWRDSERRLDVSAALDTLGLTSEGARPVQPAR